MRTGTSTTREYQRHHAQRYADRIARPVSKPPPPPAPATPSTGQVALAVPLAEAPRAVDEEEPHPSVNDLSPAMAWRTRLTRFFGSDNWRTISADTMSGRADEAVDLLAGTVGAKWWTHVHMTSGGTATRYLLLHLTNHDQGRDLMKDCIWKVVPDGGFKVRRSTDPKQSLLIEPEPNVRPLREWLSNRLRQRPQQWLELEAAIREELWLPTHLKRLIRDLRRERKILAEGYSGRFSFAANPRLRLQ